MRILVCGGRKYADSVTMHRVLSEYSGLHVLIEGDALGADRLSARIASSFGWEILAFPANWAKYGKGAGPIRNQTMLDAGPDLVIAFPGGTGTADMVRRVLKAGIPLRVVAP